jgi:hypothetical protein
VGWLPDPDDGDRVICAGCATSAENDDYSTALEDVAVAVAALVAQDA